MPRMSGFIMLPTTWWVRGERLLARLGVADTPALKALFALAVLGGRSGETRGRVRPGAHDEREWFAASLDEVIAEGHLARDDGARALRSLVEMNLVERRDDMWRTFARGPGIAAYRFIQRPDANGNMTFFTFPYVRVADSGLLGSVRATPVGAAALKLLLILGTFRERTNGRSLASYDTLMLYGGVQRRHIRRGISVLINHGLVDVFAPAERGAAPTMYFVQGLGTTPPMNPLAPTTRLAQTNNPRGT